MSFVQILEALRHYGADVLLIALGVTLLTSLLEKTVLKSCSKKVLAILPFAIGIVIFVAYRMISTCLSTEELLSAVEDGFGCGCAATLYYAAAPRNIEGRPSSSLARLLARRRTSRGGKEDLRREQGAFRRGAAALSQGSAFRLLRSPRRGARGRSGDPCQISS